MVVGQEEQLIESLLAHRETASWGSALPQFHRVIALAVIRTLGQPDASDTDRVNDLIQEVYVRLCASNYRVLRQTRAERPASLFAFVQAIAVTTTLDFKRTIRSHHRGGNVHFVPLEDALATDVADKNAEQTLTRESLIQQIERALKELCLRQKQPLSDCRDRHIFWLHYRQGCTSKEIAAIPSFNLTVKGVDSALHRVVGELRRIFADYREGEVQ